MDMKEERIESVSQEQSIYVSHVSPASTLKKEK
jgi:hypothetical protein